MEIFKTSLNVRQVTSQVIQDYGIELFIIAIEGQITLLELEVWIVETRAGVGYHSRTDVYPQSTTGLQCGQETA